MVDSGSSVHISEDSSSNKQDLNQDGKLGEKQNLLSTPLTSVASSEAEYDLKASSRCSQY